ncbi:hypothetical protein CYMTET_22205 [Cymbomonas tetramitiformis]|uniref:Uncharacterized protein n=1 Tax=Cymbomonas tetramitiformis TaxID=36881 RepID=A0AAE0L2D3_9CHLO|nr:hypothetical protein CYMTET_22205 [Cymbomonas tetramitiformis]|eukprot:gene1060-1607_t
MSADAISVADSLRHLLFSHNVNNAHFEALRSSYFKFTKKKLPSEANSIDTAYFHFRLLFRQSTLQKIQTLSEKRVADVHFVNGFDTYTQQPTEDQQKTWRLITYVFSPFDINARFGDGQFVQNVNIDEIAVHVHNLLLNRYIYKLRYEPPCSNTLKRLYTWNSSSNEVDTTLVKLLTYYTEPNFSVWMRRTSMCTFLEPVTRRDGCAYRIQIPARNMTSMHNDYHPHGACVYFDANLEYVSCNLSHDEFATRKLFQRIVSSFMTWSTWTVHLGILHALVADEWNYRFVQTVGPQHELSVIVEPLTLGTADSINLGSMLLANNAPGAIPTIVSNLTPQPIQKLMREHHTDVATILHFPTLHKKTGHATTPMLDTLTLWWGALHAFVTDYVHTVNHNDDASVLKFLQTISSNIGTFGTTHADFVVEVITMMHFNNVVHQTYSNCQHTDDVIRLKQSWVSHVTHEHPSMHVQERLVDLLVGTSGKSVDYLKLAINWLDRYPENPAFEKFHQSMQNLSNIIENNTESYIAYLNPKLVACSITW